MQSIALKCLIYVMAACIVALVVLLTTIFVSESQTVSPNFRSDFFKHTDTDQNDYLSYPEWMAYYQQHPDGLNHDLSQCTRRDFYWGDCNQDERLSWQEYKAIRGIGELSKYCRRPPLNKTEDLLQALNQLKVAEQLLMHKYGLPQSPYKH